jgi:hypothetical protein
VAPRRLKVLLIRKEEQKYVGYFTGNKEVTFALAAFHRKLFSFDSHHGQLVQK